MKINIIPRHSLDFGFSEYINLLNFFRKPKKHKSVFKNRLVKIFNSEIILSSSFRALFFNTLEFFKQKGAKNILFPSKCFYPLYLSAKKLNYNIDIYDIDDNYILNEDIIFKMLENNSYDIFVLSHEFGNYRHLPDKLLNELNKKNIIILEDQAHSLANFKISGDISFFSFGTGKDLCALSGGAIAFKKNKFKELSDFLLKKIKSSKRWDDILNIKNTLPEIIFSSFPIYIIFVFPVFYILNLYSREFLEKLFFSDDTYITKKMTEFTQMQENIALSQLDKLKTNIIKRTEIGKIYKNNLYKNLLENKTYLACAYKLNSQKQFYFLLKQLLILGIDCRVNYIKDIKSKNLSQNIIFLPSFSSLRLNKIKIICYKVNLILKNYRNI
ncbi:MAG: DegT/DnrJ/EryC1/StrS family aminotransferase [Candidatus Muirbacterium halophilum]|nr:DegT/DnrJ/EryC1/StrS family aminotransferase [Candidatus Muirbacterium halophilum]